ncbi:hypothetical protein [Leucobacter massiliensis]|uniref:Uncharacterized protein n=1 Tax=Leucobacter massiliensis TaxID=1686285 RepID=A0A2S9QMX7_9MICO|nr:hypothetical protein [Leucobacter massiliensis]PRI10944.1 hypothetical protein B4915_08655 [Leucobacter massiliensis]
MTLQEIHVGDIVRVDGEPKAYRVEERNAKTGMLVLESLHAYPRVVWSGVHEFRVQKSSVYG